jgi:hypothetical protein
MTELKKTQGFIATDPKTSSRQVQELERSTQTALKTVEGNAPCFMGYFHDDGVALSTGAAVKVHRYTDVPSERINVNGKDPDGEAIKFDKPGYYLLNVNASVRFGLGVASFTIRGRIGGEFIFGAFALAINVAGTFIPVVGSAIVRVPQGKPLSFTVDMTANASGQPVTAIFRSHNSLHRPNFNLSFVRPLEGSR